MIHISSLLNIKQYTSHTRMKEQGWGDYSCIETIKLRIVVIFGTPGSYSCSPIILIWGVLIAKFDCRYETKVKKNFVGQL